MNDGSAPWIKIITRIFEDQKIIAIGELPDGDAIIVIWFKLLCLSGEQNRSGAIYFTESVPFTAELLAAKWRCKPALVQMALQVFQKFGMIGLDDEGTIWILNWSKYQNEAGLAQIRERSLKQLQDRSPESVDERRERKRERDAERQRRWRQSHKKNHLNGVVTRNGAVTRDRGVTRVTVTPPSDEPQRETVTLQNKIEIKNKNIPPIVPQRGTDECSLNFLEAKQWLSELFGRKTLRWIRGRRRDCLSVKEKEVLVHLPPISREDRDLIQWGYSLPRDSEGWALVNGRRVTKPKQSLFVLLCEFSSEVDKWRSVQTFVVGHSPAN
jgi:predicted phage replisome organizer